MNARWAGQSAPNCGNHRYFVKWKKIRHEGIVVALTGTNSGECTLWVHRFGRVSPGGR
jgi:hypothetical protein